MNQRDLDVFHAVVIAGGAARAADLLAVSQPTVSRSIAILEREVGFPLFARARGRLVPTREGELFFAEVAAMRVGLDHLRQAAGRIREIGSGLVRVATLSAFSHSVVPSAVAAFGRKRPEMRVALQVRTSTVVRNLVASGQVDIGLAADEVDVRGLRHSQFIRSRAVCVLPRGHALADAEVIRPTDLAGERLLMLAPDDTVRRNTDRLLTEHGVSPKIAVETPYALTILSLASAGAGIGLINPVVLRGVDLSCVVIRDFEPQIQFRTLILQPGDDRRSEPIREFLACLMKARSIANSSLRAAAQTGQCKI